jgi:hypothetical protein
MRKASRDAIEDPLLLGSQRPYDKEVSVLEKTCNSALKPLLLGCSSSGFRRGSATREFGLKFFQLSACLSQSLEDRSIDLLDDVELAELVRNITKDFGDGFRVERRAVGSDSSKNQSAEIKDEFEVAKEPRNVLVRRIVVEDLIGEPSELSVVNNGEHTEGTVIQFVRCDIPRKIRKGVIEVCRRD